MKIKKLILENINSLYGRWEIDFTGDAFADGLFAIMGPTGSGKTTILDAICLALFAETPRIKGGNEFLASEVVSKGAGSCLADVIFEINGKDYLAHFGFGSYQRNVGNARQGDLNPGAMVHQLSGEDFRTQKKTETKRKIEELLGMKAEQFYRTVLLAQGKFDAFLSAGPHRAEVLEQITGTGKYTEIAKKINEKYKAIQNELNLCQAEQTGYQLLTPETEAAKKTELDGLQKSAGEQTARKNRLDELIKLMDGIAAAEKAQQDTAAAEEELARKKTAFEPDSIRLAAGEKAARVLPAFQAFSDADKQHRNKTAELEKLTAQLPELTRRLTECTEQAVRSEARRRQCTEEQTRLTELIARVSELDENIRQTGKKLAEQEKQSADFQSARKQQTAKRKELEARRKQLETERQQAESYLAAHAGDDQLAEKQALWQEQAKNLRTQDDGLKKLRTEAGSAAEKLRRTEEKCQKQAEKTAQCETVLQQARTKLEQEKGNAAAILGDSTRKALEDKADLLEQNLNVLKLIPDYQEARKRLEDGQPCPLCGSKDHPYLSKEHHRVVSEDEALLKATRLRLKKLDAAERAVLAASNAADQAANLRSQAEQELKFLRESAGEQKKQLEEKNSRLEQDEKNYRQALDELKRQLAGHGFQWDGGALPQEIGRRIEDWRTASRKQHGFETDRAGLETELKSLTERIGETEQASTALQAEKEKTGSELNALKTERNVLFGDKDPKVENQAAMKRLKAARDEYDRISQEKSGQEKAVQLAGEQKKQLEETVGKMQSEVEQLRTGFAAACSAEQLTPELFETSLLPADELRTLTETRVRLQEQGTALTKQRQANEMQLKDLRGQLPGGTERNAVTEELAGLQPRLDGIQQQIGALKKELADDQKKRQDLGELLEKIESLRQKNEIWEQLNELAGGSDGQNFRRIAQQITLGHLLRAANETLRKMNGRYELLVSDSDDKLGIDVLDHLRGEEIRTSANLSGGERFQVSLALALGLSSMSGEKIHIDSLFLDEGFGTLDPESLEHALSTLSELRRTEGKTIGIISHVKAIGENIPALIEVTPRGGGRSSLSGAGVSH